MYVNSTLQVLNIDVTLRLVTWHVNWHWRRFGVNIALCERIS